MGAKRTEPSKSSPQILTLQVIRKMVRLSGGSTMSTCQPITLARNGIAHVQQCTECGCVSIHLGATTVRLDACGLEALWAVLGEATATLQVDKTARLFSTRKGIA